MTTPFAAVRRARTSSARRTAALLVPAVLLTGLVAGCSSDDSDSPSSTPTAVVSTAAATGSFTKDSSGVVTGLSYPGEDGKTALELLTVADPTAKFSGSGAKAFVTTIGGRTADDSKHEFWALSVDGKEAQVGAGSLKTKDGETISWKIATY